MLKNQLFLKQGQNLTLTPQLQQTIRLLQLPSMELQQEIQSMLEKNPMLDHEEDNAPVSNDSKAEETSTEEPKSLDDIPDDMNLDMQWQDIYDPPAKGKAHDMDHEQMVERYGAIELSLHDHLREQIELSSLEDRDKFIAYHLIQHIDDTGYLTVTLEATLTSLQKQLPDISMAMVEAIHAFILKLDPTGIGALDLQECLQAQLETYPISAPEVHNALKIVRNYMEELGKQDRKLLAKKSELSSDDIDAALQLIRSLHPRPGRLVSNRDDQYVTPDVLTRKVNNMWTVVLNPELSPRVKINNYYSGLIKRGDKSDSNQYMRDQLQEARWFIKSLHSRNDTILRVAEIIVDKQQDYFNVGDEALKPMVLRNIAEILDMHESTISRATAQKYILTPFGLKELKFFFSTQINKLEGNSTSSVAIQALIKRLIDQENPQKPLSDSKIAAILIEENEIRIARRTIAKYRESMHIPPSNERKRIV